ncbi:uncharacterized protein LOC127241645 [Andrographis paniculata]|uniref:uncharacterized protein LOC127241645 n=1 Tax=Andrographis paniculata TaxID=175694 RepID=UPI0021E832A4|nr:uncharacterized protein LOC127241645 [Andrographis paniculata]
MEINNNNYNERDDHGFINLVFSWSRQDDIFNHNLYRHQVETIPDVFGNVDEYLGSYFFPFLEETRFELASAFEDAYRAPYANVTRLHEWKKKDKFYDVNVDHWRNIVKDSDGKRYRTLPGDILLISDRKPETESDMRRTGWTYTLASVIQVSDKQGDDDEEGDDAISSPVAFKMETAVAMDVEFVKNRSFYVIHLMNVTSNKRIWNALRMHRNMKIISKVLDRNALDDEVCEFCHPKSEGEMGEILGSVLMSKLNESQREAIFATLCKIECDHKPSVELIWGPPGTGKTATLSMLLFGLLKMGVRTLVCAPTNVAITELASRLVALVRNSVEDDVICPLGDILLMGNKDNLKIGSDIEEIFLDNRVKALFNCSLAATGWRGSVSAMLDFLNNAVAQHEVYVENELIKVKEGLHDDGQEPAIKSFLEFAREGVEKVAPNLRSSLITLVTHLPRSCISESNAQMIEQVISLLESMKILLLDDRSMTSEKLKRIFEASGSEESVSASSFVRIRSQCISILKYLNSSLTELVNNGIASKDSCIKNARLIFCTVSSSYKLHSVDTEKFKLLVIDEAAQVKEAESIIALQIPEVTHCVLVGDECQLTAMVSSELAKEAGFARSLFERLSSLGHKKHLLNMQYRMHPLISRFPNSTFYSNLILDAPVVRRESYERDYLEGRMFGPYSFMDIRGGKEEFDEVRRSRRNLVEVAVAVNIVHKLFKAWKSKSPTEKLSIGLVSPYNAQVAAIRDRLGKKYENFDGFVVKVKSVDGFQGGEEDVIIISTVRSNNIESIGFLSSLQRANVALTRARHCLWILGNERTLCKPGSVWEALINDAKLRDCFFIADEDEDIGKTIVDVKKDLDQLDEFLTSDSILFQKCRWKVIFSDNFRKSFQKLKPSYVKRLAVSLLIKLASGWRPKINVDWTCENSLHIVKRFKVERYNILCTIDLTKESNYKQVLKVWDICPEAEDRKALERLDAIFAMFTDDFISHCNEKLVEGTLEVPKTWLKGKDIIRYKNASDANSSDSKSASAADCGSCVENSKVNESLLLMKFYSLSSDTVNHLLSDAEDQEVDLPFEVTDEERDIIGFCRSSFILGRSGTGKTTILTMKLFMKLQQYCIVSRDFPMSIGLRGSVDNVLRQLFVTVSPKLCFAVRKHVSRLKRFASGGFVGDDDVEDIDDMIGFKDIPDTFVGISADKYPLVITFHKFLMMLDGTIGNSYFERFRELRCSPQDDGGRSVALDAFLRNNEVTFDHFRSSYWPHFNSNLTKSLDPSRVFTEIMSHIKGGLPEGENCDSKRSRDAYLSLSDNRVSTLSVDQRDMIYDIYESYEKMKKTRGEFDMADFVLDVHRRLEESGDLPGDKMDFVYIDEVQDLTMRQICLFRYICSNVDEGFVFSGDTGQTIARGVDFRFEDIRSLFYNEFYMKSNSSKSSERNVKGVISDIFSLSQNFRTHIGVLRLAQSVTDLISHFFIQSIDVLAPETSLIYGEPPIFLEPGCDENSIIPIFQNSASAGEQWVGFGADQVILVRDDSEKMEISKYVCNQALVLTILECKGLEFQDVLLYNFFSSSPLRNQWKVVYEFLKERELLDDDSPKSFPSFSQSRHNLLCSELKQLYVAITRTRQRLWICENTEEMSKPMLDYWKKLCLVQVRKLDHSLAQAMQRASSPEEWKSQGIKLFMENNFEVASICFEKAGEVKWEKRAKASGLRVSALSLRGSNSFEARMMLREAAELFHSIGRDESAAECFYDLEDYETAGNIYRQMHGVSELRKAGECFCLARNYKSAAEVFAEGYFFKGCLTACVNGGLLDLGLQFIESWKQEATRSSSIVAKANEINNIAYEFLVNCAEIFHKRNDSVMMMKFIGAFPTMESKRSFLRSKERLHDLLVLEEALGNFDEAAGIAKHLGNTMREIDILEKVEQFKNAASLALCYVLSNSLWLPGGGKEWPLKSFPEKEVFLAKAKSIAQRVSEAYHSSVCSEARVLSHETTSLPESMQCYIDSKKNGTDVGEVIAIRKLLDAHFEVLPANLKGEDEVDVTPDLFEARILRNHVSIATLFYVWNLWKAKSLEILECLNSLGSMVFIECEGFVRFCFNYFGVRLLDDTSLKCIVLNRNAAWLKNVDGNSVMHSGKLMTLDARHFASAARKHWQQEFLSVGLRVLEILKSFYTHPASKGLSKDCLSVCLIYIFDIAKFFIENKSYDARKPEAGKLQHYVSLSTNYFENAFPLDPRQSLSENMVYTRATQLSKNLLEHVIYSNIIHSRYNITYRQFGQVAMILLGSGLPSGDICSLISEKFGMSSTSLRPFFENLVDYLRSGCVDGVSFWLYRALEEAYNVNWISKDYISPKCFFYLVERLLILVPYGSSFFFASKSSFSEYLLCLNSDANPAALLLSKEQPDARHALSFVYDCIHRCLNDAMWTGNWIEASGIDCKYYFRVLLLRLFVILLVLCLNSGFEMYAVTKLLRLPYIRSELPNKFCNVLCNGRIYNEESKVDVVAAAFKCVGDPLVVVSVTGNCPKWLCPKDAIAMELESFKTREEAVRRLFPRRTNVELLSPPPPVLVCDGLNSSSTIVESKSKDDNPDVDEGAKSMATLDSDAAASNGECISNVVADEGDEEDEEEGESRGSTAVEIEEDKEEEEGNSGDGGGECSSSLQHEKNGKKKSETKKKKNKNKKKKKSGRRGG